MPLQGRGPIPRRVRVCFPGRPPECVVGSRSCSGGTGRRWALGMLRVYSRRWYGAHHSTVELPSRAIPQFPEVRCGDPGLSWIKPGLIQDFFRFEF